MKYIAIFDIPDGNSIGCASAKTAPNDGKIKCDSDFANVYANTIPLEDYMKPKLTEVPFYRNLVIDHMACAGLYTKEWLEHYKDPKFVWEQTVRISNARTQKEIQARIAFYCGQLAVLDYIQRMQDEYVTMSGK